MNTQTLIGHRDIQKWVEARKGQPAIRRQLDGSGSVRSQLAIRFRKAEAPVTTPSLDDGMSPCSWTAWLAELDRQNLALQVSERDSAVEFVDRSSRH
jgi:hypothetical protein